MKAYGRLTVPLKLYLDSNSTVVSGPARCPDKSSYKETACRDKTYSGKLCLGGGENQWEGNVFYDRKPLCDDQWGLEEAKLVCKELGFGRAKNFTMNSHFGLVKGPLKEVFCEVDAKHFSNCSVTSQQVCLGEEVAGVTCETADEKMRREQEEEVENKCLVTGMNYLSKTLAGSARDWMPSSLPDGLSASLIRRTERSSSRCSTSMSWILFINGSLNGWAHNVLNSVGRRNQSTIKHGVLTAA